MLRTAATLLLAPLLLTDDTPRLAYADDVEVTRTWSIQTERTVEAATLVINENDQDMGTGSTASSTFQVEVTDTVAAAKDGVPTKFTRSFETIETDTEIEGMEDSETMHVRGDSGESELVDLGVQFEWNEDAEEWARAFDDDSSGDEDWLEELEPDMDLAAILPDEDVEVGDSWDVPTSILDALLRPGGEIDVRSEQGDDGGAPEGAISISIPSGSDIARWGELEGTVRASYVELVEEDGPRLAKIVLDIDVEGELDIADELEEGAAERGADEEYTEASLTRTLEGRVTVEWDLSAGRFFAVDGKLDATNEFYGGWTISVQGFELGIEVDSRDSVEITLSATNR